MKGSPHKMGTIQGTSSALKMNSPMNQTYDKGSTSTSTATVTNPDGTTTEYPPVREVSGKVLNSLPGSVFKGGKNTGSNMDIDADKYSRFLASLSKTDGDD